MTLGRNHWKHRVAGIGAALALAGLTMISGGAVRAQDNQQRVASDPGYAPAIRYPEGGFTFLRHSSTATEGAFRGAAAYVRSLGAANLDNSLAAMNYQEAYRRALQNTLKYAETYYAKRDLWFDYKEATRRKPLTMDGYRKLAAAAGADRLRPDQYDPETGNVRWPELLQAEILAPYREKIDEALASRSSTEAGLGSRTYEVVRQMTKSMEQILEKYEEKLPTHLYVHSSKFLESVLLEARFNEPASAETLETPAPASDEQAADDPSDA
jgi:hypothetical protein